VHRFYLTAILILSILVDENDLKESLTRISDLLVKFKFDKSVDNEINKQVNVSHRLINNLESDVFSTENKKKADKYRKQLGHLQNEFKKIGREKLIGFGESDNSSNKEDAIVDERTRILANTRRQDDTTASLLRSKQLLEEAEQIGIKTTSTLGKQGETMKNNLQSLEALHDNTNRAGKIIGRMNRRQITNTIILLLVILCLLFAIIVVIAFILYMVFGFNKPGSTPPPPSPNPPGLAV